MKKTAVVLLALVASLACSAYAAESPEEILRKIFPNFSFESVTPSPIEGLYEVVSEGKILYFYPEKQLFVFGEIWTRDGQSLTALRRKELMRAKAGRIPLHKAIRIGTGEKKIIEFSDPDCPYSRKASEYFANRDDVTRYVFFFPLQQLHPDAAKKARHIICSKDQEKAYEQVYSGRYDGDNITDLLDCEEAGILDEHIKLAVELGVKGTPSFFIDGQFISGADFKAIEAIIGRF